MNTLKMIVHVALIFLFVASIITTLIGIVAYLSNKDFPAWITACCVAIDCAGIITIAYKEA